MWHMRRMQRSKHEVNQVGYQRASLLPLAAVSRHTYVFSYCSSLPIPRHLLRCASAKPTSFTAAFAAGLGQSYAVFLQGF